MQKLISNFEILFSKTSGLFFWEKDINSTFMGANNQCSRFFDFNTPQDIIGRNDYDLPSRFLGLASTFQENDKQVVSTGSTLKFIEILKDATDQWKILLVTKMPKVNRYNIIIGTIGYAVDVTMFCTKIGYFLSKTQSEKGTESFSQNSYSIGQKKYRDILLSSRQFECLFFLLRNRTAKEIARLLKLSPRTVESYIEKIRLKFDCKTKSELFDTALEHGFLNVIPETLFNKQLSIMLEE